MPYRKVFFKSFEILLNNPFIFDKEVFSICDKYRNLYYYKICHEYEKDIIFQCDSDCIKYNKSLPFLTTCVFENIENANLVGNLFHHDFCIVKTHVNILFKNMDDMNMTLLYFRQCPHITHKIQNDRYFINEFINLVTLYY